jgi:hypothetical protein
VKVDSLSGRPPLDDPEALELNRLSLVAVAPILAAVIFLSLMDETFDLKSAALPFEASMG